MTNSSSFMAGNLFDSHQHQAAGFSSNALINLRHASHQMGVKRR